MMAKGTARLLKLTSLLLFLALTGCMLAPPPTFVQILDTSKTNWRSIEVREGLEYEKAWQILVDCVAIRWDIETMSKDSGYMRSAWAYTTGRDTGTGLPYTYGRRLSCNFNEDKSILQIKTEAYYQVQNHPTLYGFDSAFNQDTYSEISGKIGRTAR